MNKITLLKQLLPGFLPLFVFIAADEIWGMTVGLIVAVVVGLLELIYHYFKEKRIEKFVLVDVAMIVVLGVVSMVFENDIFFKLKPALIELILCGVLGFSAFSKVNIMALMSQRYMRGVEMNEEATQQMKRMVRSLFWVFIGHTALVVYSAFYMSKGAWAFISGGLFYIIFALYFLYELIIQRRKQKKVQQNTEQPTDEEWVPIVESNGKIIGKAPRSAVHNQAEKLLHPVVHLHVAHPNGAIFLQKRSMNKLVQPGKWDTAVGGHIGFGEKLEDSLKRETMEEIGLEHFNAKMLGVYEWESDVERELVYTFITHDYKGICVDNDEVDEGKFWTKNQIHKQLGKGVFTPNFEHEYDLYFRR